jgi:hypothetical protein
MNAIDVAGDRSAAKHMNQYRAAERRAEARGRKDAKAGLSCRSTVIREPLFRPAYRRGYDSVIWG